MFYQYFPIYISALQAVYSQRLYNTLLICNHLHSLPKCTFRHAWHQSTCWTMKSEILWNHHTGDHGLENTGLDNQLTGGNEVVSLRSRPHFTPHKLIFLFLVLISVEAWINRRTMVKLEGLCKLKKNSMTSSEHEPATIQFVAQCFNQLRYCVLLNLLQHQIHVTNSTRI
jgi:hypothetical protein